METDPLSTREALLEKAARYDRRAGRSAMIIGASAGVGLTAVSEAALLYMEKGLETSYSWGLYAEDAAVSLLLGAWVWLAQRNDNKRRARKARKEAEGLSAGA